MSPEEVRLFEIGRSRDEQICVSLGENLAVITVDDALVLQVSLLTSWLERVAAKVDMIVELGCGYGYNLWHLSKVWPKKTYMGGDCSPISVDLGNHLFSHKDNIHIIPFNFLDPQYDFLSDVGSKQKVCIFTCHAIEQLHSASHVINILVSLRRNIFVVHFEPMYGLYDDSLLGLLRRKYVVLNDYNRDLWASLQEHSSVEIVGYEGNVLGINPLNPTSVAQWRRRS